MSGRLLFTVKFSTLPTPFQVRGGIKIGIQAEEKIVSMILPWKTWLHLEKLTQSYPQWTAVLRGSPDYCEGQEIILRNPSVQVLEKTAHFKSKANPKAKQKASATSLSEISSKPSQKAPDKSR